MGSSKTTTTQKNEPPGWAKDAFKLSGSEVMRLYQSGSGGNPYQGSAVADLSDTTMQGVNQTAQAGQNWNTAGTRPLFGGIGAAAVGPSYAEQNLGTIASGGDNPYFEEALNNRLGDVQDRVQSAMSGAGRFGSGAHTGVLTDSLGDISTQALSNQWNQNIQNQLAATGQMDAARFGGLGLGLNAAGAMADMDQKQFENQLAGADATLKAGGILDRQSQAQLTDAVNKFYEMDNAEWNRLGLLQAGAAGAAGPYGTQSGTSRTSNPGAIFGALGSAMGGMGGK